MINIEKRLIPEAHSVCTHTTRKVITINRLDALNSMKIYKDMEDEFSTRRLPEKSTTGSLYYSLHQKFKTFTTLPVIIF